ncbi:MAG: hypothetical protein EB117_14615 [Betaproteobacteria bacterium]|nr:hypothetical protein [Betaproteobacteria bacterium]
MPSRLLDNFPNAATWSEYYSDFLTDEDLTEFVFSAIASGTWSVLDTVQHGVARITALATTDDCGGEAQLDAGNFALATGKTTRFITRLRLSETTSTNVAVESDFLAGLATVDTSLIASAPTDGIYFQKNDGAATVNCVIRAGGAQVGLSSGAFTLVAGTYYWLAIEIAMDSVANKGTVTFYVNGASVATLTNSSLPSGIMTPSVAFQTGDNTGTKFLDLDSIAADQQR